jgi:hypothetical protein
MTITVDILPDPGVSVSYLGNKKCRLRLGHLARGDVAGVCKEALRDVDDAVDALRGEAPTPCSSERT